MISINYEVPARTDYFCLFLCHGRNHNSLHTALYSELKVYEPRAIGGPVIVKHRLNTTNLEKINLTSTAGSLHIAHPWTCDLPLVFIRLHAAQYLKQ